MKKVLLLRLMQTALLIPPALREWMNTLTDTVQIKSEVAMLAKLMGFPTSKNVGTLIDRSIDASWVVHFGVWSLVFMHFMTAALITWGIIELVFHLHVSEQRFQVYKTYAQIGLCFGIFFYTFFFGFMASDVFLSFMQGDSFDTSILVMIVPMGFALLFLNTRFNSSSHS